MGAIRYDWNLLIFFGVYDGNFGYIEEIFLIQNWLKSDANISK